MPTPTPSAATPLAGCWVLLADDDEPMRALFGTAMTRAGAEVFAVADGAAAVEALCGETGRGRVFDVTLLDFDMPELTGPEVAAACRRKGHRGAIVGYSARIGLQEVQAAWYAAGVDAIVRRPEDLGDLVETVVTVCGREWALKRGG